MKRGLIGIIICTLLVTVAFMPISYAINIVNNELNTTLSNSDLVTIPITVQEAWDLLTDTDNGIQIPIDIRPDEQWDEGFIDTPYPENAVHYSLDDITGNLYEFMDEYEGKEIIPYSTTYPGYTLMVLLYILLEYNYTGTIYLMMGGFTAWMEAGLPVRNNTAPLAPTIWGISHGKPGIYYTYSFNAVDPDGDDVKYIIDWGDANSETTLYYAPSGTNVPVAHTWDEVGTYILTVKAQDVYGAIGAEATAKIIIQKSKSVNVQSSSIPSDQISGLKLAEIQYNNGQVDNHPPYVPSNPIPEVGETDVPIDEIVIRWTGGDPDEDPWSFNVKYDVYFGESNPPPLVVEKQMSLHYDPEIMDMYTTYYWQIVATDPQGESTTGPIWNFTTGSRINRPPNAPDITAEKIGSGTFWIKFKLTDPDGDDLHSYAVCWYKGDFLWIYDGPYENGTIIEEMKGYSTGTHQIKARCADRWYKLSDWGYLEITVSKNQVQSTQQSSTTLFFQILQQLMNTK